MIPKEFKQDCRFYDVRWEESLGAASSGGVENATIFDCQHPDVGLGANCGTCPHYEAVW